MGQRRGKPAELGGKCSANKLERKDVREETKGGRGGLPASRQERRGEGEDSRCFVFQAQNSAGTKLLFNIK